MKAFSLVSAGAIIVLCANPLLASQSPQSIAENYADIAYAVYSDSLTTAKQLQSAVETLIQQPSEQHLITARQAWKAARAPYQQSEVFRFSNSVVDEWEGQLNAWPLDEGLIDYVAPSYEHEMGNVGATLNIIANPTIEIGGETIDATTITPELLASLNELGGSEANVATGYHAIEFLLWGQDLNGTQPGAGQRSYTDYISGDGCTHSHCDRRGQYLKAATQLLVNDLSHMVPQWAPNTAGNYREALLKQGEREVITKMLYSMGSLALGELAGERMKVAMEANSTEDEHDCFSDNTHYSHFYNGLGIENLYYGRYRRIDGQTISGPSLADAVKTKKPALAKQADQTFTATHKALQIMVDTAESKSSPMKFDQMIAEGNQQGEAIVTAAIESLVKQTSLIEDIASTLGIDNLNPDTADHDF